MRHARLKAAASLKELCSSPHVRGKKKPKTSRSSREGKLSFSSEPRDSSCVPVRNVCVKVSKNDRDFSFSNKAAGEKKKEK